MSSPDNLNIHLRRTGSYFILVEHYIGMSRSKSTRLDVFAATLARSVVETQRNFDKEHEADLTRSAPLAKALANALGSESARGVLPSRMVATETRFSVDVSVERSRAFGFSLTVAPINLGVQISCHFTETSGSRIHITIQQIPVPAHAGASQIEEQQQ